MIIRKLFDINIKCPMFMAKRTYKFILFIGSQLKAEGKTRFIADDISEIGIFPEWPLAIRFESITTIHFVIDIK